MKRVLLVLLLLVSSLLFSARLNEEKYLTSVLWQQTAAEYRAICYQAYNLAKYRLEEQRQDAAKKAVILDVDETILDNSRYRAESVKNDDFDESFGYWLRKEQAEAIPGALEFTRLADELGFNLFYITNRDEKYREFTAANMKKLGFPQVDEDHLLLRQKGVSDKSFRRDQVAENYEIILLIGDNLIDFSQIFYGESITHRKEIVDQFQAEFGKKFIILPNPLHGRWKKMFYHRNEKLSAEERRMRMLKALQGID